MTLTPPSQILIRNVDLFQNQQVLLLNHENDQCGLELIQHCDYVETLALDFNHYQQLANRNNDSLDAHFGHQLPHKKLFDTVIIYYAKSKTLQKYLLTLAALHVKENGQVLVVGDNKGGIKTFHKQLHPNYSAAVKLDNARHCLLFSASVIERPQSLNITDFVSQYSLPTPQGELTICNMVGTFSEKQLDQGTALLLSNLSTFSGRVLDFGCGAGVIAAALLKAQPDLELECVDINAMALLSCQLTLAANQLQAKVYPSDGLTHTDGKFNGIISNPPFHDGLNATTGIALKFVADSYHALEKHGNWLIVANRHLPYSDTIEQYFGAVNVPAKTNKYKLYSGTK